MTGAADDVQPPAGHRWVGVGHPAIAVPESWGRNRTRCGTPQANTVVVDVGAVRACLAPRPAGVESVEITTRGAHSDVIADRSLQIDGVRAQRQETSCATEHGGVMVWRAAVYFPAENVAFRAASSTGQAEVDAILDRIRVLPGRVGVPGFRAFQVDQERSQQTYLEALQAAGFRTSVRTELRRGIPSGFVLAADPAPGTMAHPGDLVVVTVTGGGTGPADEQRGENDEGDARRGRDPLGAAHPVHGRSHPDPLTY